jgi:hypothetical protein
VSGLLTAIVPEASYTGVVFKLAIATTEKIVAKHPMTIHLRLMRIRRYSPAVDSWEGIEV